LMLPIRNLTTTSLHGHDRYVLSVWIRRYLLMLMMP
jgi:hypothetical protein